MSLRIDPDEVLVRLAELSLQTDELAARWGEEQRPGTDYDEAELAAARMQLAAISAECAAMRAEMAEVSSWLS